MQVKFWEPKDEFTAHGFKMYCFLDKRIINLIDLTTHMTCDLNLAKLTKILYNYKLIDQSIYEDNQHWFWFSIRRYDTN